MRLGLIVLFAANTLAAPFLVLDEHLPRAQFKDNGCNTLRFPGKGVRFSYDYAGETMSQVAGSTTQTTGLKLTAKVHISQTSTCQFIMEVSNAALSSKNSEQKEFTVAAESAKFQAEMEKFDLTFTMDGDNVNQLYPNNDEPKYILNIKRGILSALQLDVSATKETDVNGICDVIVTKENGQVVKRKDLSKCEKRGVNEIGIQSTSMQTESSLKPLTSSSSCSYTVDSSKIQKVVCKENHLFRPFSAGFKGQSGALTTTEQSLTFVMEKKVKNMKPVTDGVLTPTTLIFDHSTEESKPAATITTQFERVMARLVDASGKFAATQTSAQEFTQLVMLLRKMDEKRITPLWKEYFAKDVTKQYLLDAITYCGTPTCVSVMRNVIVDGAVSGEKMNMFLQGIALVGQTSAEMINDVLEIAQRQPSRQAMLTLGTLLARHCSQNEHECHKGKSPITKAESFLETSLGQDCSGQDDPEKLETILMALKAIGNAGRPFRAFNTIMNCARTSTHKNLTVAAFDALRRMPCTHENTEFLVSFVSNEDMCPEKRIHAFRAAMRCADQDTLHKLIHRLEVEPSKQLASYMWSTLSNVMESSDPKNAAARDILTQLTKNKPLKVVNMPMHKFSRAYETSVHFDSLKTGATAEGNVVFNPDGYLPKSAFFNLTAHVMGVPVHVVEAAVQMDGLETVLADVFGPEGAFPDNTVFQMFNFTLTKEKFEEWTKKRNDRDDKDAARRQKRSANSVENKLNEMHKKVNKKTPPPSGSLSFKIMGQEVKVFSYDDLFWAIDTIDNMNVIQLLSAIAKGGHKSFSKSMLFLDMTHSVPTGLGLPLKLKLLGSTVATVELDGKFDIRNMFWGTPQMSIDGYVKPSAVVEVAGEMGIDSHFISTGVSVNANVFTSQQMKGGITYKQGQQLKINLDTPEEPSQIFNFSSTPFMFMNEEAKVIEGASRKINPDACMKSSIIGLGLCTSVRVPVAFREYEAPYFPLSGPAHFGVKLVRADPKLTTYQFLASLSSKGQLTKGVLTFSTPGAEMERKIGGDMEYTVTGTTHKVVLGTGAMGKRSEMALNFNTETRSMGAEVRTNVLTKSNIIARVAFKNQTVSNGRVYAVEAAAEYDWYKFIHETKFMALKNGPTFATSTTYYPGQTAGFSVDYNKMTKKVTARMEVNQIKQAVEISGQYIAKGAEKGVRLVAAHLTTGKQATVYMGLINSKKEKKLVFNVDAMGKTADASVGISAGNFNMEGTVMGKKAEMFVKVISSEGQRVEIGGKVGKYSAGLDTAFTNMHGHGKSLCSSAYYSVGNTRTEPILACIKQEKMNKEHMRLTVSMDMLTLKKTMKAYADIENHAGQMSINTKTFFNGDLKMWNTIDATYGDYMNRNAEVKVIMGYADQHTGLRFFMNNNADITFGVEGHYLNKKITVEDEFNWSKPGQVSMTLRTLMNGELKLWTAAELTYGNITTGNGEMKMTLGYESKTMGLTVYSKDSNDLEFGVEGHFLEKTLALINTLTWSQANQTTLMTKIILNGRTLPVSTTYRYFYGAEYAVEATISVANYATIYKAGMRMEGDRRIFGCSFTALGNGVRKIELYKNTILIWTANTKSMEQQFGVLTTAGRRYQYGYQVAFVDKTTMAKSAYALTFVLNYSTRRSSSITFTFANSKQSTELVAEVEYVPGKYMVHSISYNKKVRQLDVSIEFLPKMFVKFMTRMDKINGYQMTYDVTVEWENFKQSLQWVNAYSKTNTKTELSASVGTFFNIAFELIHDKKQPMMAVAYLRVFKQEGRLIGTYMPNKNTILFRAVFNNKEKFGITAFYRTNNGVNMKIAFNAAGNELSMGAEFVEATNRVTTGIEFNKKQLIALVGQYKKKADAIIFKINRKEKTLAEVVASRDVAQQAVFLKFNALTIQKSVGFAAKINKFTKSLTLSAEYESHLIGTTLRADWMNMVLSQHVFYNDNIVGWQAHVDADQKMAAFNVTLTPTLSAQVMFEVIGDKIVKMTVQRKFGNQVVDEASVKYTLTPKMCKLAMSWNKDTVNKIRKVVVEALKVATTELKVLSEKATTYGKTAIERSRAVYMEAVKEYSVKVLELLNNLDKSFDEIDFVAVRNQIGDLLVSALKKMAETTHKGLLLTAESLDAIKNNLPEIMSQTKELIKTLRGDLAKNVDLLMKNIDLLSKNLDEVSAIVMKVAKNLTESSRPVINKAIAIAKNFTIRGRPMSEIYTVAVAQAKEILIKYYKIALRELKALQLKGTKYVLNMKVPGRKENVDEMIKLIVSKIKELQQTTDFNKMIDDLKTQITTYKVNGKTIMEHVEVIKTEMKKLPEASRVALKKLIALIRQYKKTLDITIKNIQKEIIAYKKTADEIIGDVQVFAKPMTNHVRLVSRSVEKHFGPLYQKAMKGIRKSIRGLDLEMPTLPEMPAIMPVVMETLDKSINFSTPLVKPILGLIMNITEQVSEIDVFNTPIVPTIEVAVEKVTEKLVAIMKTQAIKMNEAMEQLTNYVEKVVKMTPEEFIDMAFDNAESMSVDAIKDAKTMFVKYQLKMKVKLQEAKKLYATVSKYFDTLAKRPIGELLETSFANSGLVIISVSDNLANFARQLAALNIAEPTIAAWEEIDILGKLRAYGVNDKLMKLINKAKAVNATESIMSLSKDLESVASDMYDMAFLRAIVFYNKVDNAAELVMDYIKSIPKKDYDTWYAELKKLATTNADQVIEYLQRAYGISKTRAAKFVKMAKKLYEANYDDLYRSVFVPSKKWVKLISEKADLVYGDIKEPTITVAKHYQKVATKFATEQYKVYAAKAMKAYNKAYKQAVKTFNKVYTDMINQMEKAYNTFLTKYGDMTWEQVAEIIYKYGEAKYNEAKTMAVAEIQKLKVLLEKTKLEAEKLYKKGTAEYERAIATAEAKYAELKPKVIAMYKKYLALIKENIKMIKKQAKVYYADGKALYKQAEGKALAIYEANKNKTLKALYNEASDMITEVALTNYNMARKQLVKKFAELKTEGMKQMEEMKTLGDKYYKQVSVLTKTVIIPEIKAELVSIINQSLRGSVELFNETVVAFYPHYVVARDLITESTEEIVAKTTVMTIKARVALKAKFQELVKQFQGLIEQVKGSEYYKQLLNMKSLEQLKAKIEEMIEMIKTKVEELKKNPQFIKYKAAAEKKITELKDLVKKYQKNEKIVQLLKVLKQIQKSSEFTANKIAKFVNELSTTYSGMGKAMGEMAIEEIKTTLTAFRSNPEATFWNTYEEAMDIAEIAFGVLKQTSLDDAKTFIVSLYKQTLALAEDMLEECTDEWTKKTFTMVVKKTKKMIKKLEKQIEKVPAMLKAKYAELEADAKVQFALYKKKANKWMKAQIAEMKSQMNTLKKMWERSPLTAFVRNQIWGELADEFINHELVVLVNEATKELVEMTKTNVMEFIKIVMKEFNIKKAIVMKDLESLKINVEDLKVKALAKFEDMKKQYGELKVLTEMKVKDIIAKVDRFFEETRIVDIVEFVQEQTKEATKFAKETQQKLMALNEKYTKMAMEMYTKYEAEARQLYAKYEAKAMKLYNEYYGKAEALFKEYKAIVMPYYLKYKTEATQLYQKYYPIAVAKYEELYKNAEVEYKKMMALYEKTTKDAIKMAKDLQEAAMDMFMSLELKNKLNTLKKMTIRQTIEELKVLPKKVQAFIVKNFNEIYSKVEAELKKRYAEALKMYTEKYNQAVDMITKKYNEIIVIITPTYNKVKAVVDWTVTEISETGIFVYRYYLLADRYNDFIEFVDAEARRIAPIVKDAAVKYYKQYEAAATEAATKYFNQYYGEAAEIAMDYYKQAQKYAVKTQKYAKKYAVKAGHGMLRGIHSSLVYLDQMDTGKMKKNMQAKMEAILEAATAYFKSLSTYITFDPKTMEITISIPHGGLFKPTFSQTYKFITKKVIKSVDALKATANEQLTLLKAKVNGLKVQMNELKEKAMEIQRDVMQKTASVRRDAMISFNANKEVAMHLYKQAKVYGKKIYKEAIVMAKDMRKTAMEEYKIARVQAIKMYGEAKADAEVYLNKMRVIAADAYLKAVEMISEMYNDPMSFYYNAGRIMVQYRNQAMKAYTKYMPIAEAKMNMMYKQMKKEMIQQWNTIKLEAMKIERSMRPYRASIEKAIRRYRNGIPARVAFEPLFKEARIISKYYSALTMKTLTDLKNKVCNQDKKLCTLVSMSLKVHKMLYNKYTGHTTKMFEITKAEADKYVDMGRKIWMKYQNTLTMPAYKTVGMIFGKSHVLTFDGKFYDFINYKRPDCTYLLARDFADGKFTIMSQKKSIIFKNDDLEIQINDDGTTKTMIGNKVIDTLPIEAGDNNCVRDDIHVTCYFNKKSVRIVVDLENFFATIAMSAWDQGKSQGLLGSNDGESYNDWRLPNGKITKDIYQLANAYEMTGNKKCKASPEKFTTPACNKKPSPMCAKLFKDENSPFAEAFKTINPEPFFKACEADTADCKSETGPCSVVAAFRKYAENMGIDTSVEEGIACDSYKNRKVGSEWTQTPLKRAVDIVVVMSERKSVNSVKAKFANLLKEINRRMTRKGRYNVRFSLIGFGGNGINEKAHIRPIKGDIFVKNIKAITKMITTTKYDGSNDDSNDAYHAILEASRLRFRPGASRVFFLYNTEAHTSHKDGPSLEETMTALTDVANASLFVFDKVAFKNIKKNKIIGQTNRKIFTSSHTQLPVNNLEMPASEFKELVQQSQGGLFSNKFGKGVARIAHAVYEGVRQWLSIDNLQCKKCVFDDVWPVCTSRADLSC